MSIDLNKLQKKFDTVFESDTAKDDWIEFLVKKIDTLERIVEIKEMTDKKSKSCIFFHKWDKWEEYNKDMYNPKHNVHFADKRQKRTCLHCGKVQDEFVA
jgi:hypothetical protein